MGFLSFDYGVMGAGKSQKLLGQYHSGPNSRMYLALPCLSGLTSIESRNGYSAKADFNVIDAIKFFDMDYLTDKKIKYLLVDEAQFLVKGEVQELKRISYERNVEVYCFGLLTDFKGNFFEGSQELIRLADFTKQKLMSCEECASAPATMNAKKVNDSNIIDLDKSKYAGVCYKCWLDFQSK